MGFTPDPNISVTITVPYSGEVKDGLLIIVKPGSETSRARGLALYRSSDEHLSSQYKSAINDIGVTIQSYSDGVFTLNLLGGSESQSYEVAFLQLNLD